MQLLESVVYSNVKSSEPLQSWRANMEIGRREREEEKKETLILLSKEIPLLFKG